MILSFGVFAFGVQFKIIFSTKLCLIGSERMYTEVDYLSIGVRIDLVHCTGKLQNGLKRLRWLKFLYAVIAGKRRWLLSLQSSSTNLSSLFQVSLSHQKELKDIRQCTAERVQEATQSGIRSWSFILTCSFTTT